MKRGAGLLALLTAAAIAAGCGSGEGGTAETWVVDETSADGSSRVVTADAGGPGTDGSLSFRVLSVEDVDELDDGASQIVAPPSGARFVVALVEVANDGVESLDPFCGQRGAQMVDDRGRYFDMRPETVQVSGNTVCRAPRVQPGLSTRERLVFAVPSEATVTGLVFWDYDQEGDEYREIDYVFVPVPG